MKSLKYNSFFPEMLAVLFIGLKLTGHIDWGWWWVLSPILIPLTLLLSTLIIWLILIILKRIYN